MPGISVSRTSIPFGGGIGFSFSQYWATLISATVEDAAPTHVVLTFPTAKTELGASDFTIAGFTVSSASWTGAVLTLVITPAVLFYHRNLTITFVKTGETATVTNNVAVANTVGWYVAGDGSSTYVTKDGSDFVSVWKDLSGSNHPLNQANGTNQPLWESDGILFDGVDNFMKTAAFVWVRPSLIYAVLSNITWTESDVILDSSDSSDRGAILQYGNISPYYYRLNQGANANATTVTFVVNKFYIHRFLFNGAASYVKIGANGEVINPGTSYDINGLTLGAARTNTAWSNIKVKELILRNTADSDATQSEIYNYLATKYGFATI